MKNNKKNKKKILMVLLALLLIAATISTTIAWLTKTSKLTNTFTIGEFTEPTTDPTDPSKIVNLDGNLYEPSWDGTIEHKLMPGVSFDKDPYVGIGKNSEDAVVYVYIENNFSNKVYFNINEGWEAVDAKQGSLSGTYTSGLFKYTENLIGKKDSDTWTNMPLFSKVVVNDDAEISDLTVADGKKYEIVVSSFLHQAKDDKNNAIDQGEILNAAKTAFGIN